MPVRKLQDYTIETKKEFVPRKRKIYLLLREERREIYKFIKEQLIKEYIRPLKLSQMILVFFIEKKNISIKKVFTRLDLRQRYNNIWIKKGDKQKIASMTLKRSFEPTMMFFGLTNSPATFQIIINKIFWDLINIREITSFINNVIVGIEKEERHDKIVEKIVKRLVENNLYKTRKM